MECDASLMHCWHMHAGRPLLTGQLSKPVEGLGVRSCQSTTSHTELHASPINSDALCIGLCRPCDIVLPLVSVPPHMLPPCLFVCLFIPVPRCHVLLALFVYFPFWIVSVVDRQQANAKSNCTHCIRRGLGRRLRSSLLLNPSPRCDLPCRILYLMF